MALRFYNTLTQSVEDFSTQDGKSVRMYTCGPTVYHYVHIGNLRTFTFQDILRRWLRYRGYQLNHVMNITDVEDKIIRNAMEQGKPINEYTAVYEKAFLEDIETLRLQRPERIVRATLGTLRAAVGTEPERTALILVGRTLAAEGFGESRLYAGDYDRRYRPVGTNPRFPAGTE